MLQTTLHAIVISGRFDCKGGRQRQVRLYLIWWIELERCYGDDKEYWNEQEIQHTVGGCHTTLLLFCYRPTAGRGHFIIILGIKMVTAPLSVVGFAVKSCWFRLTIAVNGSRISCLFRYSLAMKGWAWIMYSCLWHSARCLEMTCALARHNPHH